MKHIFENIAVTLVVIFSIAIIVLIVQYNLIKEEDNAYLENFTSIDKNSMEEQKKSNYLDTLENYRDKDIRSNTQKVSNINQVKVKTGVLDDKNAYLPKEINDVGSKIDALLNQ